MTQETTSPESEHYLRLAMEAAEEAARAGNHPYGAVLVDPEGAIIATGGNGIHTDHDPSSHAEMNVIRQACRASHAVSLEGYRLFTNGAPCTMCATVILRCGLAEVWYSAPPDPDRTLPTLEELIERSGATVPKVYQGVLASEATAQLARLSGWRQEAECGGRPI